MPKIQAQTGTSLADIYEIQGSIAGVEELESRGVSLVHEMGEVIFSERFSTQLVIMETAAIAQSTAFDVVNTTLPEFPGRILGLYVFADANRVDNVMVAVRDPASVEEMPIWAFNGAIDDALTIRLSHGGAPGAVIALRPDVDFNLPSFFGGRGQRVTVPELAMRGTTTAFGAGDVTVTAVIHIAFGEQGGIGSKGLPIPSW